MILCPLCITLFMFIAWVASATPTSLQKVDSSEHWSHDFRPCSAIGPRIPAWANRLLMQRHLPFFSKVYEQRLIKNNGGGMRYDHSFALWFTLRNLRPAPKVVVESGAHRGHSTWLIKQALPRAKIVSISPEDPMTRIQGVEYKTGKQFTDFSKIAWNETRMDLANAVVLFDDHQSADIRIIDQGRKAGFRRFIYDDNYAYPKGDNLSMKWLCETEGQKEWPGVIKRNFGRSSEPQTWEEHIKQAMELKEQVKYYVEFPPIMKAREYSSPALVEDRIAFEGLVGPISKQPLEFGVYAYICYVETF